MLSGSYLLGVYGCNNIILSVAVDCPYWLPVLYTWNRVRRDGLGGLCFEL